MKSSAALGGAAAVRLVTLALLALAAANCAGQDEEALPPTACWPNVEVQPAVVAPGSTVKVSSQGFGCGYEPHGGKTKTYRVVLVYTGPSFSSVERSLGSVGASASGAFETTFEVPLDVPPGATSIYLRGSRVDRCDDGNDCPVRWGNLVVNA